MECSLPQAYVSALPARIIAARRAVLLSLLPSGVTGGGYDEWWEGGPVNHGVLGQHIYSGDRWQATSTPAWGGISESGRSITVTFTVTNTAVNTGEKWQCDICDGNA